MASLVLYLIGHDLLGLGILDLIGLGFLGLHGIGLIGLLCHGSLGHEFLDHFSHRLLLAASPS